MVMIGKATAGDWTFGAHLSDVLMSFVASVVLAKGILDERSRARFVDLAHKAATGSLPGGEMPDHNLIPYQRDRRPGCERQSVGLGGARHRLRL